MPSWRPDATQQRLWLGANRYSSGRRNSGTDTKCLAYSCIKRYPLRGYESDSDTDCNSNGYRYPNCDSNTHSDGHSYRYSNAQTDAHAQVCADTEASSHTRAQTVTVFAKANIVASGDK
jgi:hypothetical protein